MQQSIKEMERMKRKAAYDALTETTKRVLPPEILPHELKKDQGMQGYTGVNSQCSEMEENNISLSNQVADDDKIFHVTLHNVRDNSIIITADVKNLSLGCVENPNQEFTNLLKIFQDQVTWMQYTLDLELYALKYNCDDLVDRVETDSFARGFLSFSLANAEKPVSGNRPAAYPFPTLNLRTLSNDVARFKSAHPPTIPPNVVPYEWATWALSKLEDLIEQSDLGSEDYFKPIYTLLLQNPPPAAPPVKAIYNGIKAFMVTMILLLEAIMRESGIPYPPSDEVAPLGTYANPKRWTDDTFMGDIHLYPRVGYFEATFNGNPSENNWYYPPQGQSNPNWIWKGEYAGTCSLPKPWGDMTYIGAIHFYRQTFNPTFSGYYKSRFNGVATEENKHYFPTSPEESNAYWTWIGRSCATEHKV